MVELVTGHANKAHATAEQAAGLNAGILGLDDYVLNVHDKFELTVVSANKVTIGTGELVMQGRHVSQGTPEDLIVTNGSQGQKRNDLIVCRYAKGSQSIESAELVVVRGTPTTGTPTDPTLNTTSPLDGGTTYDMPFVPHPVGRHQHRHTSAIVQRFAADERRVGFPNPQRLVQREWVGGHEVRVDHGRQCEREIRRRPMGLVELPVHGARRPQT